MIDSSNATSSNLAPTSRSRCCVCRMLVSLILFSFLLTSAAYHLRAVTVSVSVLRLEGAPGEQIHDQVVLLNTDLEEADCQIEIVDWDRAMDGVTRTLPPGTLSRSCASWITLSHNGIRLEAGEEHPILIDIDVPPGVQGTSWAGLLVSVRTPDERSRHGSIGLLRQFLIRVFVTTPPLVLQGIVSGLQIEGINPLSVEVTFANTGDTLLSEVTGLVVVETEKGVSLLEMPLETFELLPNYSTRQSVEAEWGLHIAGLYLVRAIVDFGAEYLVAGQSVLNIPALALVPIGTSEHPPLDLDGNGLVEDLTGDGLLTLSDVDSLREFMLSDAIQDNARAFDFNNDGVVSALDVDVLQDLVLRTLD